MSCSKMPDLNDFVLPCIEKLLTCCTGAPAYAFMKGIRRIASPGFVNYWRGIYFLEYGRVYIGLNGWYYEGKVSYKRARRYLKKALRHGYDVAKGNMGIAETYYRDRDFKRALDYYDVPSVICLHDPRIVLARMELNYLLKNYRNVSEIFENFNWGDCEDAPVSTWAILIYAFAKAQTGLKSELRKIIEPLDPIDKGVFEYELAINNLIELFYIAGDEQRARNMREQHWEDVKHCYSPCYDLAELPQMDDKQICERILASFTPYRIIPHSILFESPL